MNKEENDILVELLTLQKEVQKVDRHIYNNYKRKIYKLKKRIDKAIEYINKYNKTIKYQQELGMYREFMIIPKELLDILGGTEDGKDS